MGGAENRMLRYMCGHTRKERKRNDCIQEDIGVTPIEENMRRSVKVVRTCKKKLHWKHHLKE